MCIHWPTELSFVLSNVNATIQIQIAGIILWVVCAFRADCHSGDNMSFVKKQPICLFVKCLNHSYAFVSQPGVNRHGKGLGV